ncbi:ATP-binding protein [Chitiniphilus purpureus]|uniref:histidine kinase n=1 Tax=Chitiniphilus purpureus TaxID=2981137 RepID=A0ABY6DP32_9NEIS|nr:ATP-binding protein [Chitiniphilus sp. CD1]UXY14856.1 ATP-binding protein [Chitiniphilus sp. CD1]
MTIRCKLILLILAVLLPTLLGAVCGIWYVYRTQHTAMEQSMRETTHALALAVDREIARRDAVIATLATSPTLQHQSGLPAFYHQARQVAKAWDSSIMLFDIAGRQMLNTRLPLGDPLPQSAALVAQHPKTTSDFVVTNLYWSESAQRYSFSVQRPVLHHGEIVYFITMGSFASQMGALLDEQRLPPGWLGVIVDSSGRVVARNMDEARFVGQRTSGPLAQRLATSRGGSLASVTLSGVPVLSFYSKAPASDWAVIIARPQHEIRGVAIRAVAAVALGSACLLALALALAYWFGRRIAGPLRQLDDAAQALGRGDPLHLPATGLLETDRTARVLLHANAQIQDANRVMAERVAQAVAQAERSQQALLQSQKLEALGRLTGGIAHDFNNLLQTLTVGLQVASRSAADPKAQQALAACIRSVARGGKLTRQLMAFGRQRAEETSLVALRELLLGMAELLEGALPGNITLTYDLSEMPCTVRIDPLQCELAVLNLVLNARDAMPRGGPVTVTLRPAPDTHGMVTLQVSDGGSGMPPEVAARAFEPFFTTKPVGEGSGLGLAQVYGFVRQSGGSVQITSQPGQGTCITLQLPAGGDALPPRFPDPQPAKAPVPAHVLLVDDDDEVRTVVAPLLGELGFVVSIAHDAGSALACYDRDPAAIDIVFSDVVMPGPMDGLALARALHRRDPHLPVVLATGYTEHVPEDDGFKVLAKPYAVPVLAQTLREALAERTPPAP